MNTGRIVLVLAFLLAISTLVMACSSSAAPTPTAATPSNSAKPASGGATDAETGKTVFASNCNGCHPGGGSGVGPDIKGKSADVVKKVVRQGAGAMPPFPADKISDQQLDALAAYISTLK